MKKTNGITLIVLIITVIVMLILVGVSIKLATDGKLIGTSENTVDNWNDKVTLQQNRVDNLIGELDRVIQRTCSHEYGEWLIIKEATCEETGSKTRTCKICKLVQTEEILALGHRYVDGVCQNGCNNVCTHNYVDDVCQICGLKQISIVLSKTTINESIESGSTATVSLTATLKNATGNLTWTSSMTSVAEISGTGETRTIILKSPGTAIITVSYGEYEKKCTIKVTEATMLKFQCIYNGGLVTAKAKEGMTWEEFVNNPEYNTIGLWLWNDAVMLPYSSATDGFISFLNGDTTFVPGFVFWGELSQSRVLPTFKWEVIDSSYFSNNRLIMGSPTSSTPYTKEMLLEDFEAAGGNITYWSIEP